MIKPSDIKEIFRQHQSEVKKKEDWGNNYIHDYHCIRDGEFSEVANEIIGLMMEQTQENATLCAKVKVYEAIIENSNFKMAVKRGEK